MNDARRTVSAALGLLAAAAMVAGCGGTSSRPPTSTAATATTSAPAASDSGVSNGRNYTVTTSTIDGRAPNAAGKWHVEAGLLFDGEPAVADAFNKASQASARQQIDEVRANATAAMPWTLKSKARVSFRNTAVAQIITGVYNAQGAPHPVDYVATVVIDSRTAKPITLADLFTHEQDGLNRLSEQTRLLLTTTNGNPAPAPTEPGIPPTEQNFANWILTAQGMEIHFNDDQLGHALPVVTVPWSALTDVLAPTKAALAQG